ncbi:MAG: MerR family transcriptional regulator [Alphaproteobacteria bacterium]|nr:MerR family transcriptional regulator [Alphaproteobacteria bacterium]
MNEPFISINELSKRLDIPAYTLRYWEKQFPTAIKPTTGAGGRRYYRPETIAALEAIKTLLYDRGMTIAGVKKLIKDGKLADLDIKPVVASGKKNENPAHKSAGIKKAIDLLELAKAELV